MKSTKVRLAGVVILLAFLLLYPFETAVVPEWKIRVVDEAGKPVPRILVKQGWREHSIELHRNEQTLVTDEDGYVYFPRRRIRAGLLHRTIGRVLTFLNPHGQSGTEAFADVIGPYTSQTDTNYTPGKQLPNVIVIRPQP
jgi:hypothetical protein